MGSDAVWDNGKLKMQTQGGDNGWWGVANSTRIGPKYFNTPTNWTNTETEFRIEELPRTPFVGSKECVLYSYIIRLDDNNYISIELHGNHYGYDFITVPGLDYGQDNAHRLLLRTPNSRQHILNQSVDLSPTALYIYDFKIKNLNNVWSVSYKQSLETTWQTHTISGLTNPSGLATVKPYFMIWSGDGGNTHQNGSGAFNIDYYKVHSIATTLPVELLHFKGIFTQKGNLLTWATVSEKNNDHFDIERSTDAKTFSKIGVQKGYGTTSQAQNYDYLDTNPFAGVNYYRLKQVDTDGQFTYSKTVSVEMGKRDKNINIFPNPVSNDLTVVFDKNGLYTEGVVSQLELYNLQGQLLKQQPLEAGFDESKVSMQQFPAGVYMISLRQNGQIISTVKVTKN